MTPKPMTRVEFDADSYDSDAITDPATPIEITPGVDGCYLVGGHVMFWKDGKWLERKEVPTAPGHIAALFEKLGDSLDCVGSLADPSAWADAAREDLAKLKAAVSAAMQPTGDMGTVIDHLQEVIATYQKHTAVPAGTFIEPQRALDEIRGLRPFIAALQRSESEAVSNLKINAKLLAEKCDQHMDVVTICLLFVPLIEKAIEATPTGPSRNALCDLNIRAQAITEDGYDALHAVLAPRPVVWVRTHFSGWAFCDENGKRLCHYAEQVNAIWCCSPERTQELFPQVEIRVWKPAEKTSTDK